MRLALQRLLALIVGITGCSGAQADERRAILSLVSGEPALPWTDQLTRAFVDVVEGSEDSPTLYFEYVDSVRFETPEYAAALREWLGLKYRDRRIDLLVSRGEEATLFLSRANQEPWPEVPLLYTEFAGLTPEITGSLSRATGILVEDHTSQALGVVRALLPGTERVFLVYGGSATEAIRYREFSSRLSRAGFETTDLGGLAMGELLERVSALPENSIVLLFVIQVDADGRTFPTETGCRLVSAAANRPTFSLYGMYMGCGIVGGLLLDFSAWGEALGERALEALDDPSLPTITIPAERHARLVFDARELERWGIEETRLPTGSEVLFREPSLWRDYRPQVLAAVAVALVQALLIAGLLFEHRRRQRAEIEARRHLAVMSHVDRRGALGELAASLAHELGQPLAAILANAKAAELMLAQGPVPAEEIRAILDDIRSDDLRAAQIIRGMRELLQKRELTRKPVELNGLVRDTAAMVTPDARSHGIEVELSLAPGLAPGSGEPIYLQQVLLNLLLNAIAAAADEPPERRRVRVQTMAADGALEVVVSDTGHGIPEEQLPTIFEPFVTTKEHGLGVGLSIARSIVEAHGGRIEAANNRDGGATFRFSLPLAKRS
jgi:signal transduction histidine kinase